MKRGQRAKQTPGRALGEVSLLYDITKDSFPELKKTEILV